MRGSIITYLDMCRIENSSLQRGMNFRPRGRHSIFLMSTRPKAPYRDRIEDEGTTLIYEGHDAARSAAVPNPKQVDQPGTTPAGTLTENGKFYEAAHRHEKGKQPPDLIRVYEKLRAGIWTDNGYFHLLDAWQESDGHRQVYKFRLKAVDAEETDLEAIDERTLPARGRLIPSARQRSAAAITGIRSRSLGTLGKSAVKPPPRMQSSFGTAQSAIPPLSARKSRDYRAFRVVSPRQPTPHSSRHVALPMV